MYICARVYKGGFQCVNGCVICVRQRESRWLRPHTKQSLMLYRVWLGALCCSLKNKYFYLFGIFCCLVRQSGAVDANILINNTWLYPTFSWKPSVDQNIALRASLTANNSAFSNFDFLVRAAFFPRLVSECLDVKVPPASWSTLQDDTQRPPEINNNNKTLQREWGVGVQ